MKQKPIFSDLLFKEMIENSYSGITLLDASFKPIYRSRSAQRITGWDALEPSKLTIANLIYPADQLFLEDELQNVLAVPGLSLSCCFRAKHYHGHYIWLESTFTNRLDNPAIVAIVCNFREITEKKREEHHLKLLESVITNTMDAVMITEAEPLDEQGPRILFVNEAFTK